MLHLAGHISITAVGHQFSYTFYCWHVLANVISLSVICVCGQICCKRPCVYRLCICHLRFGHCRSWLIKLTGLNKSKHIIYKIATVRKWMPILILLNVSNVCVVGSGELDVFDQGGHFGSLCTTDTNTSNILFRPNFTLFLLSLPRYPSSIFFSTLSIERSLLMHVITVTFSTTTYTRRSLSASFSAFCYPWPQTLFFFSLQFLLHKLMSMVQANTKTSDKTALQVAAHQGHQQTVVVLLNAGADPAITDSDGDTAYHYAAYGYQIISINLILSLYDI